VKPYNRIEPVELSSFAGFVFRAKARENLIISGENYGKGCQKSDEPIQAIDTKKELAKIAQVSHDTIADLKLFCVFPTLQKNSDITPIA